MNGESRLDPKGQDVSGFVPEIVTPDLLNVLQHFRSKYAIDSKVYFKTLATMTRIGADRTSVMQTILNYPDLNMNLGFMADAEPYVAQEGAQAANRTALSNALGVGKFILGEDSDGASESYLDNLDQVRTKFGKIGRILARATSVGNEAIKIPLDDYVEKYDVDTSKLFEATTAVAAQYSDSIEVDSAVFALVKMSGLSAKAKSKLGIMTDFKQWSLRFDDIAGKDADTQFDLRAQLFEDIMAKLHRIAAQRRKFAAEPIMDDIIQLDRQYSEFIDSFADQATQLTEVINQIEDGRHKNKAKPADISGVVEVIEVLDVVRETDPSNNEPQELDEETVVVIDKSEPTVIEDAADELITAESETITAEEVPINVDEVVEEPEVDDLLGRDTFDDTFEGIALQLEWEVLPPAEGINELQQEIERHYTPEELAEIDWGRVKSLMDLQKQLGGEIYRSKHKTLGTRQPYFVLCFDHNKAVYAVAENPQYGNATYVLREDKSLGTWQEVLEYPKRVVREMGGIRINHSSPDIHLERVNSVLRSLFTVE